MNEASKTQTNTTIIFQWQTSTEAIAHEFTTKELADKWMEQKVRRGYTPSFYKSLVLVKIETTITRTLL